MPHFVVEYSRRLEQGIDIAEVMEAVFRAGAASSVMNADDIKVRGLPVDHFRFEDGCESFLHVTVSLLAGRTDAQKEALATALRTALADGWPRIDSISIDIRDMNAQAYKKRLRSRS